MGVLFSHQALQIYLLELEITVDNNLPTQYITTPHSRAVNEQLMLRDSASKA